MARSSVKVIKAALDETETGDIILRGVLDPDSLDLLQVDSYQREVEPLAKISALMDAMVDGGSLPDIELGVRGGNFIERGDAFYIEDPTFIVDGLQRVSAARLMIQQGKGMPRLGAAIRFNTDRPWELERFRILNTLRAAVSPNIHLRNAVTEEHPGIHALHSMSTSDPEFALRGRVQWGQRQKRDEFISALTLAKVAGRVHAHVGPGRDAKLERIVRGLDTLVARTGRNIFRDNVRTFFALIDESWGLRALVFSQGAVQVKANFLLTLAGVLSDHPVFWNEQGRLVIGRDLRLKIGSFSIADPEVVRLASAGSTARELLELLMIRHVNSGRRTRRLVPRVGKADLTDDPDDVDDDPDD